MSTRKLKLERILHLGGAIVCMLMFGISTPRAEESKVSSTTETASPKISRQERLKAHEERVHEIIAERKARQAEWEALDKTEWNRKFDAFVARLDDPKLVELANAHRDNGMYILWRNETKDSSKKSLLDEYYFLRACNFPAEVTTEVIRNLPESFFTGETFEDIKFAIIPYYNTGKEKEEENQAVVRICEKILFDRFFSQENTRNVAGIYLTLAEECAVSQILCDENPQAIARWGTYQKLRPYYPLPFILTSYPSLPSQRMYRKKSAIVEALRQPTETMIFGHDLGPLFEEHQLRQSLKTDSTPSPPSTPSENAKPQWRDTRQERLKAHEERVKSLIGERKAQLAEWAAMDKTEWIEKFDAFIATLDDPELVQIAEQHRAVGMLTLWQTSLKQAEEQSGFDHLEFLRKCGMPNKFIVQEMQKIPPEEFKFANLLGVSETMARFTMYSSDDARQLQTIENNERDFIESYFSNSTAPHALYLLSLAEICAYNLEKHGNDSEAATRRANYQLLRETYPALPEVCSLIKARIHAPAVKFDSIPSDIFGHEIRVLLEERQKMTVMQQTNSSCNQFEPEPFITDEGLILSR